MSFWYLASPYSAYPGGIEEAYRVACAETARLISAGVPTFSPIAHSHGIAVHGDLDPLDHAIWMPADRPMMDAASGCIVLRMPGWDTSRGVAEEMMAFTRAGKPIRFMTPGQVPALR